MSKKVDKIETLEKIEHRLFELKVLEKRAGINLGLDFDKAINRVVRNIKSTEVSDVFRVEVSE